MIVVGENTYASVIDADQYANLRGITDWLALDTAAKESALILGCDYLEVTYSQSWLGSKTDPAQPLSWPRRDVVFNDAPLPSNVVPTSVVKANIEMAIRAAAGEPLIADQSQQVVKEKVDVLEITYREFSDPATRYPYVNRLIGHLLRSGVSDGSFQQTKLVRR